MSSEGAYVYAPPCCISCGFPIGGEFHDYFNYMRKKKHMELNSVDDETIFKMSNLSLMHSTESTDMGKILDDNGIKNTCCRSQLISWVPQMR